MKILHIITGLKNGGAEAVLYRLCTNKNTRNCDQIIISLMDEGKYGPLLRKSGLPVYCLKMPRGRVTIKSIVSLVKILRSYNPDIIQTWMYHADLIGGLIARIIGFNCVFWGVHNIVLDFDKAKKSTVFVKNLCILFSRIIPKHIIFSSEYAADHHKHLGYPSDKFYIIHNGVDLKKFFPNFLAGKSIRKKLKIPSNVPLFGMVARYDPYKDHQSLLEALKVVKDKGLFFRCLLVGDGINKQNNELMILLEKNEIKDWVLLMGPQDDIYNVMNAFDIHILSSISESFGNVLAEAMACGIPCISTDIGMPGEIVGDTGWVVPPKNPKELAKTIIEVIDTMEDSISWKLRKNSCRNRISNNFSDDIMASKYHIKWQNIFNQNNKSI